MKHQEYTEENTARFQNDLNVIFLHAGNKLFDQAVKLDEIASNYCEVTDQEAKLLKYGGESNIFNPAFYRISFGLFSQIGSAICMATAIKISKHIERSY